MALKTKDLWSQLEMHVGSDRHVALIDKLAACRDSLDERLLQLHESGHTLQEMAEVVGATVYAVQERWKRILRRANPKCPPDCKCLGRLKASG